MAELDAIGIVVRDIAESVRFYRALGLDVPDPPAGEDHFDLTLPGGLRLMWDTEELIRRIEPEWPEPQGQRIVLAFRCANAAEVDDTYRRLVEAGFEGAAAPFDAFWGQRYATALDPDGNKVDLFATL